MKTKQQRQDVHVTQGALNYTKRPHSLYTAYIAQVIATYSDRMTCDIVSPDGQVMLNIPVQTKAGLIDGKPYGDFWLPELDDYVIVRQAAEGNRKQVITGTFVPYLSNDFMADAVNSDNKQYTLKLLEEGKEKHYKKIFRSGTTFEVEEDGTIIVETPRGAFIRFAETGKEIHLEDPQGNIVVIGDSGVSVTDKDGNAVTMSSSGMELADKNGNTITMGAVSVSINGNLEVLQ